MTPDEDDKCSRSVRRANCYPIDTGSHINDLALSGRRPPVHERGLAVHAAVRSNAVLDPAEPWVPNYSRSGRSSRDTSKRIDRGSPETRSRKPRTSRVKIIWCTAGADTLK